MKLKLRDIGESKERNQLKSATNFPCTFNDVFRFLINSASAIFRFRLLLR